MSDKATKITIIVILIFLFYMWESESRDWRVIRFQERVETESQLLQYKQNKNWSNAEVRVLDFNDYSKEIYIYRPKNDEIQLLGIVFFIQGTWGNIQHWEQLLTKLANQGYIVVGVRNSHELKIASDIDQHLETWHRVKSQLIEERPEILQLTSILIGHSYGGLVAQFICQYTNQFSRILLISPFFGLNINPSIFSLECIYNLRHYLQDPNEPERSIPSFNTMFQTLQYQNNIMQYNCQCDFDIGLILSANEDIISNKKALEFYESIQTPRKQLFISKYITHYSKNDNLLKIINQFLEAKK